MVRHSSSGGHCSHGSPATALHPSNSSRESRAFPVCALAPHAVIRTIGGVACLAMHLAQVEPLEAGIMNTRRFATVRLCRSVVLAGCVVAWPAAVGLAGSETTGSTPLMDPHAPVLTRDAEPVQVPQVQAPQVTATDNGAVGHAAAAPAATEPISGTAAGTMTASIQPATADKPESSAVETASTSPSEMLPTETPPAQATTASPQNRAPDDTTTTVSSVEILDECYVVDTCVDRYLWALYL